MYISERMLYSLLKEANDHGHNGLRVMGLNVHPINASDDERKRFQFILDHGPTSATENW